MKIRRIALLAFGTTLFVKTALSETTVLAQSPEDMVVIKHLMMKIFDKPDTRPMIEPVTVLDDIAVVGWSQGERGGRALLRRKEGAWFIALCGGNALKQADALRHFGLSSEKAASMAVSITQSEAKLAPATVAKFSRFEGIIHMDKTNDVHHAK